MTSSSVLLPAVVVPDMSEVDGRWDPLLNVIEGFPLSGPSWQAVAAALALATRVPFNPNATSPATGKPLLHTILASDRYGTKINGRVLPRSLQELEKGVSLGTKKDGTPAQVDLEWLAAWVLAAGANPWVTHRTQSSHDPYDALDLALNNNLPLLVEVLLESPGAPSAADRGASLPPSVMRTTALNWWSTLVAQSGRLDLLEVLSRHGAAHDTLDANGEHPLSNALPEVVAWYAQQGWLPTDPNIQTRLQSQWVARSKQAGLSLESLKEMSAALIGEQNAVLQHRKALVGRLLTRPSGYNTQPHGFTLEELLDRVEVARGPSRGNWTGLAALAVAHWRGGTNVSAPEAFDWSNRVSSSVANCVRDDEGNWSLPEWVGQPGVLKSALGVEWKPGICLDGALALQACMAPDRDQPSSPLYVMLGVVEPKAWVLSNMGAAARFTVALLEKSRSDSLQEGLVSVWGEVVSWMPNPNEWGVEGWHNAYEVGKALRGVNGLPSKPAPQSYDIQARLSSWYDEVLAHVPVDTQDQPLHVLMSIERALLVPTPTNVSSACDGLMGTSLSTDAQRAVAEYANWPDLDAEFKKVLMAAARASRLQDTLDAGQAHRSKPRF